MRNILVLFFLIALTYGCDPSNCYWTIIENDTNDDVIIQLISNSQGGLKIDSVSLEKGDEFEIFHDCWIGTLASTYPIDLGIDSIHFGRSGVFSKGFNIDSENRNPFINDNWVEFESQRYYVGHDVTIKFVISNEDVEAWR